MLFSIENQSIPCPPFCIIKSNRSQTHSDLFDSAPSLILRQVFVLSLYKRGITRMVGRYVHSTTTHTSLLKTHVIFNNKTLKTIKQYMYNIILPLNFPHIYLHGLYLIKPHQTPPYTDTACISLSLLINSVLTTSCRTKWSIHSSHTTVHPCHEL